MTIRWRTVKISESFVGASYAFECQFCGALCWQSGKKIHEDWHNGNFREQ